jgi:hypothetical protein
VRSDANSALYESDDGGRPNIKRTSPNAETPRPSFAAAKYQTEISKATAQLAAPFHEAQIIYKRALIDTAEACPRDHQRSDASSSLVVVVAVVRRRMHLYRASLTEPSETPAKKASPALILMGHFLGATVSSRREARYLPSRRKATYLCQRNGEQGAI